MLSNSYMATLTPATDAWTPLSAIPLVADLEVLIWTVLNPSSPLSLKADSDTEAQLPKNVQFRLTGVDLSKISIRGENKYRVTVIARTR